MRLEFRVDWGYQFLYSRRHYHPEYRWDGRVECAGGRIDGVWRLEYPVNWFGPCQSAVETRLEGTEWKSVTRRGMAGIRVEAECDPDASFVLRTAQGDFAFSARDVVGQGRLVFPVGSKFSHCSVIVTRKGHLWFRPAPRSGEVVVRPDEFEGCDVAAWARMESAWIEPGADAAFEVELPVPEPGGESHWLMHIHAMTAGGRTAPETQARDYFAIELRRGDDRVAALRTYLRFHDPGVQMLHDLWAEIPVAASTAREGDCALVQGHHRLTLANLHPGLPLLINRISFRPRTRRHLDWKAPAWALVAREFILGVRTLSPQTQLRFEFDPDLLRYRGMLTSNLDGAAAEVPEPSTEPLTVAEPGWHEFRFVAQRAALSADVAIHDVESGACARASTGPVYDLPAESPEVLVGYDMTTVPHDDTGEMDWLLDYTQRTQLGNLVCFRPHTPLPVADGLYAKWGRFCREHGMHVEGIAPVADGLPEEAGSFFHSLGAHELSGQVYAHEPDGQSRTMAEAAERFVAFMRGHVESTRAGARRVAFGDASGGHRYSLLAGADFVRAETMVQHTMQHLSQVRPAAQALGCGEWGVHIAIQHAKQPYLASHLRMYELSLMQAWMMGANFVYEEDSLFQLFKEERQCWDDTLTKGKRDMTRAFHRFAATHPRRGRPDIRIAGLLGRHAAPFNGFICDSEQDPSYSVWGRFGRKEAVWGHRQPEKAAQVMDVLMPGASTHPLRQVYDRRRFFFSGTPFGDFDQVPIEAASGFLARYKLLLHLGWHTATAGDHAKLLEFVRGGGTLLLGVPQLSTHEGRGFLETMDDLALMPDDDVTTLCGVRVVGKGPRYCGNWWATTPDFRGAACPAPSRAPSVSPDEDGPCHLAEVELRGARTVVCDALSGKPMLVEHRVGAGRVLLMTVWAYPGHEELADFSGAVVAHLCGRHAGDYRVLSDSSDLFWNHWPEGEGFGHLMVLDTDWTRDHGAWGFEMVGPAGWSGCRIGLDSARPWALATYLPFCVIISDDARAGFDVPHIEVIEADAVRARLRVHAVGRHSFRLFTGPCEAGRLNLRVDGRAVALGRSADRDGRLALTVGLEWAESSEADWELWLG